MATPAPLEFVETYLSQVFLTPTDVWKVKKPVYLGFLDYTTLERRRLACEAEVRLNRDLAPDVYHGVVPVTRGTDGRRRIGGDGEPVDWAVHMRRLPDADRLDSRLREGRLTDAHVSRLARALAVMHERARSDEQTARLGSVEALSERIGLEIVDRRNAEVPPPLPKEAAEAEAWQRTFLAEHVDLFEARAAAGRVRDGHGELSLEHVFIDEAGDVNIIDRLEFDDGLRVCDVCSDVAFLSTDLAGEGRADLAERLLAEYAGHANDFDLYPLVDFYSSLRASMRGRVEWFFAAQFVRDPRRAEERRARARRLFLLSLAAPMRAILPPVVVALGGLVASGKSTLAARIAADIGAPVVSSDRTRDFMLGARAGGDPHEVHWERAYEEGFTQRGYDEVMRRAGAVLASGRPVVIDGCFRSVAQRATAREAAERFGHPILFVEARVPKALHRERLRERALRDGVPEQTWIDIAEELRAQWEPADELAPDEHLVVDTSAPLEESTLAIRRRLPTWPEGLTG
jgi:aminoglycoside phosphotransferase family enzyme/predicted kinase